METLGGNEVNPGYRTKTIAAEVSQGQSRHQNKNKNEVNCKIEKTKALVKKSPTLSLRKITFFVSGRKTLRTQINIGNKGNHDVDKKLKSK